MVIRALNLLGDTLYSLKPLAELRMQRPEEDIVLGIGGGLAGEMIRQQFGTLMRYAEPNGDFDIDLSAGAAAKFGLDCLIRNGRMPHISECYAGMLGISFARWNIEPLTGWAHPVSAVPDFVHDARYVVISPFSASCSSASGRTPNKMLAHAVNWDLTINWIREQGYRVILLKAPHECWLGTSHVYLVSADSLNQLQLILAEAKAVISVDNGIGHIASALGCRTCILWPPIASVPFIAPLWSRTTKLLFMQPQRVRGDQLLTILKRELAGLL